MPVLRGERTLEPGVLLPSPPPGTVPRRVPAALARGDARRSSTKTRRPAGVAGYIQNHTVSEAEHPDGDDPKYFDVIDEFFLDVRPIWRRWERIRRSCKPVRAGSEPPRRLPHPGLHRRDGAQHPLERGSRMLASAAIGAGPGCWARLAPVLHSTYEAG